MTVFLRTLVLSGILLIFDIASYGQLGNISGRITDRELGTPLFKTKVSVLGTTYHSETDFHGNYTLINIPVGTYTLQAKQGDYYVDATVFRVKVEAKQTTELNFTLISECKGISASTSGIFYDTICIIPPSPKIGWDSLRESFFLPKIPKSKPRRPLKDVLISTEIFFDSLANIDSVSVPSDQKIFLDVIKEGLKSTAWVPATKKGYPIIYKLDIPLVFYHARDAKPLLIKFKKPPLKKPKTKY